MLKNLNQYLSGIAIGIRFRPNFSIEDRLGSLIDQILYKKESYFNPEIFPEVLSNPVERRLMNEQTGDNLVINTSNIILQITFGDKINVNDIDTINERFEKDIINDVMDKFEITQINRAGYIKRYLFKIEELSRVFINKTVGETLEGVNDINLRFSRKYPLPESMTKKDVNDYDNVIYNIIKRADREEIFISVDYQRYFDPTLDKSSQLEFTKFLGSVEYYNSVNYVKWLDAYYRKDNGQKKQSHR
jgi:hypothetical protein